MVVEVLTLKKVITVQAYTRLKVEYVCVCHLLVMMMQLQQHT